MPAIITHDSFGRDVYRDLYEQIGESRDELDAFLLGNQGPDVLFYGSVNPLTAASNSLGTKMHRDRSNDLISTIWETAESIPEDSWFAAISPRGAKRKYAKFGGAPTATSKNIAQAYAMGFICHYVLDSTMHPFIYAQQYELCDAGVKGLDRSSGHEVHATIESELDELVLTCKRGETISTFDPSMRILKGSDYVLDLISAMYCLTVQKVYDRKIAADTYKLCVKAWRQVQRLIYSSTGIKRNMLGRAETLFRRYSFLRALSHQNRKLYESIFDNHEHMPWRNPETLEVRTADFWQLYDEALNRAEDALRELSNSPHRKIDAHRITDDLNFNGSPTVARIIATEDVI